ncbi:MAG: hypothetical protein QW343_02285 [Candidatus Norongarragalinales archaeon]
MIVLLEHMDYFVWRTGMRGVHSPLEEALGEDNASGGGRNCLVAYTTVESEEEEKNKLDKVALKAARSVNELARELGPTPSSFFLSRTLPLNQQRRSLRLKRSSLSLRGCAS